MKRILAVLMATILLFAALPMGAANVAAAGFSPTGDCLWMERGGNLYIIGEGAMGDYANGATPWSDTISYVQIGEGVTAIGSGNFRFFANLTEIYISKAVTAIGANAFEGCLYLADVYYAGSKADRDAMVIATGNTELLNATWHYSGCEHVYDNNYDADCNLCGEIREDMEVVEGDVDGDGQLAVSDVAALQQYLSGWDLSVLTITSDMNHDGNLNNKDLILLMRRYAGWEEYENPFLQGDLAEMNLGIGDKMVDFTTTDIDGRTVTLSEALRGRDVVFITFWFADCPYAKSAFPSLQQFYDTCGDRAAVLTMNSIDDEWKMQNYRVQNNLSLPMLAVPDAWAEALNIAASPTTVVIDKNGVIRGIHEGAYTQMGQWINLLNLYTQ